MASRPSPLKTITTITTIDTKRAATDIPYARSFSSTPAFVVYTDKFTTDILGGSPELSLVASRKDTGDKFAHEAGVYIRSTNAIYFTSNYQTSDPRIDLYAITADTWQISRLTEQPGFSTVSQANGACNYQDKILYCAQGDIARSGVAGSADTPSSLTLVDLATNTAEVLLNNFYGREFSSLNDVVVHHFTGDIWFTDPTYGYEQGFRPPPSLPKQVYRFDPRTGQCWAVADGFVMCNGLCFSLDYSKMYITDTGAVQSHGNVGDGHNFSFKGELPSSIYVYDVLNEGRALGNRRLFAVCGNGVPDGIKCDENGYVYAGCGDGVHVWDAEGGLVGKIVVGGVVANFCFVPEGMWLFAEEELWFCKLGARGPLGGIEWDGE
ncbi:hypothetical protein AJ79_00546 [Helicocarpus griseus UAMH5409]|uniref:SMP-30/Gluconolactonase/LRE-like region domain-containing protein n=1 Tax=Helicocarpus griseus UAMH5409 TaxID=1447875 RepID=A0A2B7YBB1_9EURO|nr:hypothetical protein AJ79_00546 [Helicocarpus griseus UAMH5409]